MKLPGIKYRGVQSLGRGSVTAPLQVASAEAGASEAWSRAMNQGAETYGDIIEDIAVNDRTKAANFYTDQMLKWGTDQTAYDQEGKPAWSGANGADRYNNFEESVRNEAQQFLSNKRSEELFGEFADDATVRFGSDWHKRVVGWKKDDDLATGNEAVEKLTQTRDFDGVANQILGMSERGLLSRVQTEKMLSGNEVNRTDSMYSSSIEASEQPDDWVAIRSQLADETGLSEPRKAQLQTKLNNRITEHYTGMVREVLVSAEENVGLAAAVLIGDEMIHALASVVDEDVDGLDSDGRQVARNANRQVWSEWNSRLTKATAGAKRSDRMRCAVDGTCFNTTEASEPRKAHEDYLNVSLGRSLDGASGYINNGVENKTILANDEDGVRLRSIIIEQAVATGSMSNTSYSVIDAALTQNDQATIKSGAEIYHSAWNINPASIEGNQSGIIKEYAQVMQAFPPEMSSTMIQGYKQMGVAERNSYFNEFVDARFDEDQMNEFLESQMPHVDGGMAYFDTAPTFQRAFKGELEARAKSLMAFTKDTGAAYQGALNSLKGQYGVDQVTGKVVERPFATSVPHGEKDGGEWVHRIIEEGLPGENNGEMPENYNVTPMPGFNPAAPEYVVTWLNDEAELRAIGLSPRFEETTEGQMYFKDQAEKKAEEGRQQSMRIMEEKAFTSQKGWDEAPLYLKAKALDDIYMGFINNYSGVMRDKLLAAKDAAVAKITYNGEVVPDEEGK